MIHEDWLAPARGSIFRSTQTGKTRTGESHNAFGRSRRQPHISTCVRACTPARSEAGQATNKYNLRYDRGLRKHARASFCSYASGSAKHYGINQTAHSRDEDSSMIRTSTKTRRRDARFMLAVGEWLRRWRDARKVLRGVPAGIRTYHCVKVEGVGGAGDLEEDGSHRCGGTNGVGG